MSIPHGQDDYIASMYDFAGKTIARRVRDTLPPEALMCDVGAGWGKYRFLLPEYEFDAIEVWQEYAERCKLNDYYRYVYIVNVKDAVPHEHFDGVIFGDVLEHLTAEDGVAAIENMMTFSDMIWVAVPFLMPQEPVENNPYEEHRQTDLTEAVMAQRYPMLRLFEHNVWAGGFTKAVYEWQR